ncbi:DUF1553 domain-containing protein [Planctomicrobium sp. SH527]|uniref:DUF1553 domain-containing protein n=1 Tax=Planctomicrobium sp. SH527 TaxID=3448123 RepID=UPI003F5BBACD
MKPDVSLKLKLRSCVVVLGLCSSLVLMFPAASRAAEQKVLYNRDVRPILAEACFSCHGPDSASRKAELRLDQRGSAVDASAIVPGDVDASELVKRILSTDEHEVMPPPETKKVLSAEQKQTLRQWIQQGAEYELHWAFIAPEKPVLPQVKNPKWGRNEIDLFVLAELEKHGLTPAPEADRRTIARRVSLDLTGMPPTPDQVDRFVNDPGEKAYETFVDSLLASTAWGEHRGRYWLDYARYADTHGIHFDNFREMWSYRDWVIGAFNRNMRYDQFTIENLAGDLLPNATLDQKIASGFNRCNMTTNEGGIIDEEYLVLYTRDRTETTALVWMGLTAGCAVCHTHKFDPLTQKEFYELAAFFNNTTQAAKDGNIKDTPPIIVVPQSGDVSRWDELLVKIQQERAILNQRESGAAPDFEKWLATADPAFFSNGPSPESLEFQATFKLEEATALATIHKESTTLPLDETTEWIDGPNGTKAARIVKKGIATVPNVGDFERSDAFTVSAWINATANDGSGAIVARMDEANQHRGWDLWIEGRRVGSHIIHNWPDNALKVVSKNQIPANKWVNVTVSYDGSGKASGVSIYFDGVLQQANVVADKLKYSVKTDVPFKIGQRDRGGIAPSVAVQEVRLYRRLLPQNDVAILTKADTFADFVRAEPVKRTEEVRKELYQWWLRTIDATFIKQAELLAKLEQEKSDLQSRGTIAHVMQEKPETAMAFILNRGEYDQRLDQVAPGTPQILPPFPEGVPRNRLTLAQWLLQPNQPLTSRVTVNRFWQEVFGTGLVESSGDFGIMGDLPSHPELLDWLALDFVENGWDVKRLFKQIVMSSAYRQAALTTAEKREADPKNRLLSRGPRFRMDAEMVRDSALSATGTLVRTIGGPSVKPYQPDGIWEVVGMMGSTTRNYKRDSGDSLYRRSLYTFVKRMAPPASMEIFNAPNREYCVIRRERTNTPLQALVTLNDEQFVEAARTLAQYAIRTGGDNPEARVKVITQHLLSRDLQPAEMVIVLKSLESLRTNYDQSPEDAKKLIHFGVSPPDETIPATELAAWTMLTNELMNLDEMLNK